MQHFHFRKIMTIAIREYRAMVGTKAFLFSMAMMPLLMFGGIFAMDLLSNVGEINERKIVVIDHSGKLYPHLNAQANLINQALDKLQNKDDEKSDDGSAASKDENDDPDFGSFSRGTRFLLEAWEKSDVTDEDRLALSDRIRRQEIYAFVEIPADVLTAELPTDLESAFELPTVAFYAEDAGLSEAKQWLRHSINEFVKQYRLKEFDIDPVLVAKSSLPIRIRGLGLVQESSSGEIQAAKEKEEMSAIFLPLGVMMLMFMVIFMASQPMLEGVLEEKSQRIAEVLLGSVNPFQLMTGKLFGTVAGSLTIFAIYLGGGYFLAVYRGWTEHIPLELIPWFIVFQIGGVLFYASIFLAVGSSVTQLKEAQSLLLPVWMMLMSPMFVWIMVVREPNGLLAKYFSLFPPATPTMMMLRMSTGTTIPTWQPLVGVVILTVSTIICVYIAARIFRVGLLWQGKTPKLNEIMRWALRG